MRFGSVILHGMDAWSDNLILIVIGAHLRAEVEDRPLGYELCDQIKQWQSQHTDEVDLYNPVVCSDLWYLNHTSLMLEPTICLGDPEINAATAFLANRVPSAMIVDHTYRIHLDPEFIERKVCLWGVDAASTQGAYQVFVERYLDSFLHSVHDLPPPHTRTQS